MKPPSGLRDRSASAPSQDAEGDAADDAADDAARAMRAVWRSMRREEPSDRGLVELLAAARAKATAMEGPSAVRRLIAAVRRPRVMAFATVMVLIGAAVLVGRHTAPSGSFLEAPGAAARTDERSRTELVRGESAPPASSGQARPGPADPVVRRLASEDTAKIEKLSSAEFADPPAHAAADPTTQAALAGVPTGAATGAPETVRATDHALVLSTAAVAGDGRGTLDGRGMLDELNQASAGTASAGTASAGTASAGTASAGTASAGTALGRAAGPPAAVAAGGTPPSALRAGFARAGDRATASEAPLGNAAAPSAGVPGSRGGLDDAHALHDGAGGSDQTLPTADSARRKEPQQRRDAAALDQLAERCESAAQRGDCAAVRELVGRITRSDRRYRARLTSKSAVARCLAL